jgi:hypothetical protein
MQNQQAIRDSVDLIATMFLGCAFVFGVMLYRLLTTNLLTNAWQDSDAEKPADRAVVSIKMIGLMMAIPVVYVVVTIMGELPHLWRAFPLWSSCTALWMAILFALIGLLFWTDRENVGDLSIEPDRLVDVERRIRQRQRESKIVGFGFSLWILGLCGSFTWILHLASMSLSELIRNF